MAGDDDAFAAALRSALAKFVAVKPAITVEPPRAAKLARASSVAAYAASFGTRRVRIAPPDGRGRGLVAARAYAESEFIFAERPVLKVDDSGDKFENARAFSAAAFARGDAALTALLRDLARAPGVDALAGAYLANAMEIEPTDECGVFPLADMCNHACDANCGYAVDDAGDILYLQANAPIAEGEELTLSYVAFLDETRSTRARRAELRGSFGFTCACARCSADDADPPPLPRRKRPRTG